MITADERLRAAARDAGRIFPADGDLPPLRLSGAATGRRPSLSRAASRRVTGHGTGRGRVWLAPLAAAAAIALVSAGVVVLRQSAGSAAGARPASKSNWQAIQLQHRRQLAMAMLVIEAYAPATGPQYDRGTRLIWLMQAAELRTVVKCMAESGYHISDRPAPFDLAAYADNTQMPDLPRIGRTHEFVPIGPGSNSPPYSKTEQHAYTRCWRGADVPFRPLRAASAPLLGSWFEIVARIQSSAQVRADIPALNACATRYGFPNDPYGNSAAPIKSFADFMDWIAGFMDGAGSRGASVSALRALARHWTTVFVTCASPIVGAWQRLQLVAQHGFLARHAAAFRQLDQLAWRLLGSQVR